MAYSERDLIRFHKGAQDWAARQAHLEHEREGQELRHQLFESERKMTILNARIEAATEEALRPGSDFHEGCRLAAWQQRGRVTHAADGAGFVMPDGWPDDVEPERYIRERLGVPHE